MQIDASQTMIYTIPFFISVISWVKMLHDKKKSFYMNEDQKFIERKIEILEYSMNKNKSSILGITNEIEYIDETLVNMKNKVKNTIVALENMEKINNSIETSLSHFEIIINEKFYELEKRIKAIENKSLDITDKIDLKIINPDFLMNDDMYSHHMKCESPYNIIYTSSTNVSCSISPTKNNEWVSLR